MACYHLPRGGIPYHMSLFIFYKNIKRVFIFSSLKLVTYGNRKGIEKRDRQQVYLTVHCFQSLTLNMNFFCCNYKTNLNFKN